MTVRERIAPSVPAFFNVRTRFAIWEESSHSLKLFSFCLF